MVGGTVLIWRGEFDFLVVNAFLSRDHWIPLLRWLVVLLLTVIPELWAWKLNRGGL